VSERAGEKGSQREEGRERERKTGREGERENVVVRYYSFIQGVC
jgi:hypothetical protein